MSTSTTVLQMLLYTQILSLKIKFYSPFPEHRNFIIYMVPQSSQ